MVCVFSSKCYVLLCVHTFHQMYSLCYCYAFFSSKTFSDISTIFLNGVSTTQPLANAKVHVHLTLPTSYLQVVNNKYFGVVWFRMACIRVQNTVNVNQKQDLLFTKIQSLAKSNHSNKVISHHTRLRHI